MIKSSILAMLFVLPAFVFSQSYTEKRLSIPVTVSANHFFPKEDLLLSPDGNLLCIIRKNQPFGILLMNMRTGMVEDSLALDGYSPIAQWSPDGSQLVFFSEGFPSSFFYSYDRQRKQLKKIAAPDHVLNFALDSSGKELVAATYDLPSSGATYGSDITGAYIFPKGIKYNYKIISLDIAAEKITDSIRVQATYPRIEGKWKGSWLMMLLQSEAELQFTVELNRIDFDQKKFLPVANSKELFVNEPLYNIRTLIGEKLCLATGSSVIELEATEKKFVSFFSTQGIETIVLPAGKNQNTFMAAGIKADRWAENELLLVDKQKKVTRTDLRDFIPHLSALSGDSVSLLYFREDTLLVRRYPSSFSTGPEQPEVLIQNSIKATERLIVPNSDFLLEFNDKEWQVSSQSSQLIVYQKKDYENYGMKFISMGDLPYIIRYGSSAAEMIATGKWKEVAANIFLKHALLKDGTSVYSTDASLVNLAYNPATSLLVGFFYSNNYYHVAAWDLNNSYSPQWVVRMERKQIPGDTRSVYQRSGTIAILLTHIIYQLSKNEWEKLSETDLLGRLKKSRSSLSPYVLEKLDGFNDFSDSYSIEKGKVVANFNSNDIFGHWLLDLNEPSSSVYFSEKPLKGVFPGYKHIAYEGTDYGIRKAVLSDKGNFIAISDLGGVSLYDIKRGVNKPVSKGNSLDGAGFFLLEDKAMLIGNSAWYDASVIKPVFMKNRTLPVDSASYLPEKKLFLAKRPGDKKLMAIKLDRLVINTVTMPAEHLQGRLRSDSVCRKFFAAKKSWVIVDNHGIGYDTAAKAGISNAGRLSRSSLDGNIDFVQFIPEQNQLLVGNTGEAVFECWDLLKEQWVFKLFIIDEKNFFIQSRSGNYYATPAAIHQVGFVQNGQGIPASFLDGSLNRPDLVLTDIFEKKDELTNQLIAVYKKAAARKNNNPLTIVPGQSPVVTVSNPSNTIQQKQLYPVNYNIESPANAAGYFGVQLNNVMIWDTVFTKPVNQLSASKSILLSRGENQLVFLSKDDAGHSSVPVFQRIVYKDDDAPPTKTYVIAIGVNHYSDSSRNLKYAVKDGKDLLAAFRSIEGEQVITDSLFDDEVSTAAIKKLRGKLMQTGIEDKVIICFSGHGMLDDSLNFYLATHDMDFTQPRKKGCSFAELEDLLTGIPARKKLLMIDACHSGNVDREDVLSGEEKKLLTPGVSTQSDTTHKGKGVGITVTGEASVNLQQVISQLFASSSSKSGAEVIAATAGDAYAYESAQWNNGVFTYAVLKAFEKNSDLDKNFDQQISIKELKRFIYSTVVELTGGKQQPLSRYENPNYDWGLLPLKY